MPGGILSDAVALLHSPEPSDIGETNPTSVGIDSKRTARWKNQHQNEQREAALSQYFSVSVSVSFNKDLHF